MANSLATVVHPHIFDRMMEIVRHALPEFAQHFAEMPGLHAAFYIGLVFGMALPLAALYFLWTRRAAYRAACPAK